jgi:hypothetical protein
LELPGKVTRRLQWIIRLLLSLNYFKNNSKY